MVERECAHPEICRNLCMHDTLFSVYIYIYIDRRYDLLVQRTGPRCGGKFMKSSSAYPLGFGKAVCKYHAKFLDSCMHSTLIYMLSIDGSNDPIRLHTDPQKATPILCHISPALPDPACRDSGQSSFSGSNTRLQWSSSLRSFSGKQQIITIIQRVENIVFYRSAVDVLFPSAQAKPVRAPFNWKHADLEEVRQFLIQEKAKGVYKPLPGLGGL